jgi:hypothetical protein
VFGVVHEEKVDRFLLRSSFTAYRTSLTAKRRLQRSKYVAGREAE